MPTHYLYLIAAIVAETIGTTALQASAQFTRLWPSVLVVIAYALSFYLLSQTLRIMPVGIVYAIWSGLGIVLIAAIGLLVFGQRLDWPAILGMCLIVGGILVIHLFSKTASH
ncbi:DMT family transporter [Pukyongiella litopenaei]|uniref:QacE family quaternary ammonium compound efflux SMR transporter n=1 Tax=Pukyongiella litopenaei TaxID=2605946 RepID=A0A2S0MTT0_9RHOB|nr:SMR family transporter [Pukyongiella litopenaei]AVO39207.1 QacE family quaternary ammonium compound efflux SMR transporter [Pukyongiella litopenaei]